MICRVPPAPGPRPALSICIPTWNRSARLCTQLLGLVPHLSDRVEIVVVDNGSSDDTLDAAARIAADHPAARISLWTNEANLGADVNYLRALELGAGEWLWLVGDDEIIDASKLAEFIEKLGHSSDLAMLYMPDWQISGIEPPLTLDVQAFLAPEVDMLGHAFLKIGLVAVRREAAFSMLRQAYREGIGDLHAYGFLTLGLLNAGSKLSMIEVPGLFLYPEPAADHARGPHTVRWNALQGEMGAWRSSEKMLSNHRAAAQAREVRLRLRSVLHLMLLQMAHGQGGSPRTVLWALRSASLRQKPIGLAIAALSLLPPGIARPIAARIVAGATSPPPIDEAGY